MGNKNPLMERTANIINEGCFQRVHELLNLLTQPFTNIDFKTVQTIFGAQHKAF